jgi:hypothetical protein
MRDKIFILSVCQQNKCGMYSAARMVLILYEVDDDVLQIIETK